MNYRPITRFAVISLSFTLLTTAVFGQGIDFFHGTWEEALELANEEDKIIFVDAYAVWCGPCKRMAKQVFTNSDVGKFYNKNFINVKMDMERGEGPTFGQKYPVSAFPTLFYIDKSGEIVLQAVGAQQVDGFIELGQQALSRSNNMAEYAEKYDKGDRDPILVYKYVQALNRAGESSLKVANDHLNKQVDFTTPENLKFILEATTIADSKIFDLLIEHRAAIEAVTSKEEVADRIIAACEGTVDRAIEYQSETLLEDAKSKMRDHLPDMAIDFSLQEDMRFCIALHEAEGYLDACKKYAKKEAKNDPEELEGLAATIIKHFKSNAAAMAEAESYARTAAKKGNRYNYYLTYAQILDFNGKKNDAIDAANKSLELALNEPPSIQKRIKYVIQQLQDS